MFEQFTTRIDTMMGFKGSEYSPLDLLGAMALDAGVTQMACDNPNFRFGISNDEGKVPIWMDFRLWAGAAATIAGQMGGSTTRRVAHDVATGTLSSLVATEVCRWNAMKRMDGGGSENFLGLHDDDDIFGDEDELYVAEEVSEFGW